MGPEVKPISEQADWCMRKWCYVDPCNCDASDASKSDYFPGELTYTYGTCGDKNTYTATESATNTVGNAECTTAAEPASDANSVKMGLGLLLAGMGALARALTQQSLWTDHFGEPYHILRGTPSFPLHSCVSPAFGFLRVSERWNNIMNFLPTGLQSKMQDFDRRDILCR